MAADVKDARIEGKAADDRFDPDPDTFLFAHDAVETDLSETAELAFSSAPEDAIPSNAATEEVVFVYSKIAYAYAGADTDPVGLDFVF